MNRKLDPENNFQSQIEIKLTDRIRHSRIGVWG